MQCLVVRSAREERAVGVGTGRGASSEAAACEGLLDSKALRTHSRGECPVALSPSLRCFHSPAKGLESAEGRL